MAELHISWASGRREVRTILPLDHVTLGDSRRPVAVDRVPLGDMLSVGTGHRPYCTMTVHGDEMPGVVLVTERSRRTVLPGVRRVRRERRG